MLYFLGMAKHKQINEENMFKLYFEYDGNVNAMLEDENCLITNYPNLYNYCKSHSFKERLEDIKKRAKEMTNEQLAGALVIKRVEIIAIVRGVFVKYAQKLEAMKKVEDIDITMQDVERAYKIFKTEIGEATEINRHEFSGMLTGENIYDYFLRKAKARKN